MRARTRTICLLASAVVTMAGPSARAEIRLQQERFLGRGTRGPYMLSLQGIEPRTEQVSRNGVRLEPGRDYMLDQTLGMMSFTDPLRTTDVVNVSYSYDTAKATKPGPTAGSFGLLGSGTGGLALNYAFKPDAYGNQMLANLGFNGETALGGGKMSTNFMMDKTAGPKAGREAQNMQFAFKNDTGRFKYDLGYSRVGNQFSPAEAMKLLKGSQALNINTSLQFSNSGALTFKKIDNTTPDAKKGTLTTALESTGLNMDLAAGSKLTALHERQSSAQGANSTASNVDRLQLDQKLGGKAAASLIQETVTQGKNGQSETVTATRLNTTMSGGNGLSVQTALALTDSDKRGHAREAGLQLAQGAGATKVTLAVNDRKADFGDLQTHALGLQTVTGGMQLSASLQGDKNNTTRNETGTLGLAGKAANRLDWGLGFANYSGTNKAGTGTRFSLGGTPLAGLNVSASRLDDHTSQRGNTSTTKLALGLTSIKNLKIDGSMLDDTMGAKPVESQRLNIEATPLDAVKLTATHAADLNDKGDISNTLVKMEATPVKALTIAATHNENAKNADSSTANGLNFEAKPSDALKVSASVVDGTSTSGDSTIHEAAIAMIPVKDKLSLSTSYREEQRSDQQIQTTVVQANVKPSEALAMTGSYTQRDTGAPEQINTVDAQVTLKPADGLQMIGTFSENPIEKNNILRLIRRGLTLKSQVGALSFSGGYVTEESLVDDAAGAHAEFSLGLRFSKNAQLKGGYQQTVGAIRGYKPLLAYNMSYNHTIGSDFNLSLEGNVTERDNSVPENQRQEVKATANLGMRF